MLGVYKLLPMRIQNYLVAVEGNRRKAQRILNDKFIRWATFLNQSSSFSEEKVKEYQTEKLARYLVEASEFSEFWNVEMHKISSNPKREILSNPITFLNKLPRINKSLVVRNKAAFLNNSLRKKDIVMTHTGGTTGSGFRFPKTIDAVVADFAFIWFRRYFGVIFGDKYGTFNSNPIISYKQSKPPFWQYNSSMNQTLFSIYHLRGDWQKEYAREIASEKYRFVNGFPSAISTLANYIIANDMEVHVDYVFPSSETLLEWQRGAIERAFHAKVIDSYTNGEQSALIYECSHGSYHCSPEYSFFEFERLEEQEHDSMFRLIGTSFLNSAIFLIRYDTGDIVSLSEGRTCSCGRPFSQVDKIHGREDEYIYTKDKRPIGRASTFFMDSEDVEAAQILQRDYGELLIRIVPRGRSFISKEIVESKIRTRMGKEMKVTFEIVDELERAPSGKVRFIVSHITKPN